MKKEKFPTRFFLICVLLIPEFLVLHLHSQELEPRIYSNLPMGLNFAVAGFARSAGEVLVDASLPVEDFNIEANMLFLGYARSLNLFGKSGQVQIVTPYVFGEARAILAGQDTLRPLSGFADPRIRIGINLIGAPALGLKSFGEYHQKSILGISLQLVPPFGKVDQERRVNIGSNRWSFKPELGFSQALTPHLILEIYGGVWIFTKNTEYLMSSVLSQDILWTSQSHLIYTFGRGGPWIAANATFYSGGATYIDGLRQKTFQENYRLGLTFSLPFSMNHALKINFSTGVSTRFGQDFDTFGIVYQYRWLKRTKNK